MQFTRLRLRGFKSFVEPTELLIEPGLTGVVGPNGCGKSNLVEALRWVMGETSPKRMRGGEMDDVIFSGTAQRPSHNHAEVALNLDNAARSAPAQFNDLAEIDVVRRIDRERGSTYRVNGKEVRARDVQLLFADQSTGAHSTALVSQGRVGSLINAKPVDRRHLLEEAAGITGLHSRRHEAELRLRAAEANLERLDDVVATLESQLQALQRQARQAKRYRKVAEQIRRHEAILLHLEAAAAEAAHAEAQEGLATAEARVAELTEAAAARAREQAEAQQALPELRRAEAEAGAELQRLALARDGLEREAEQARAERARVEDRLEQIDGDRRRAAAQAADADAACARLADERRRLEGEAEGEAKVRHEAEAARDAAAEAAAERERALGELSEAVAADEARAQALDGRIEELRGRLERLARRAEEVETERARLQSEDGGEAEALEAAEAELAEAEAALAAARESAQAAGDELAAAREAESEAREALRAAESEDSRLQAEIDALAGVLETAAAGDLPPVIDAVRAESGSEAALGAALGEDLSAPADDAAPVHWAELPPYEDAPALPAGAEPLSRRVEAPAALARRLDQVGVVADAAAGARLQPALRPGQRLVTPAGDLWRWDGYTAAAEAPTAAAQRLEQANRLAELRSRRPEAQARVAGARRDLEAAAAARQRAAEREQTARQNVEAADARRETARGEQARLAQAAAAARQRLGALAETAEQLAAERGETQAVLERAAAERGELPDLAAARERLAGLRAELAERRAELAERQSAVDRLARESEARARRLEAIDGESRSWAERAEAARGHLAELEARREAAQGELDELAARPDELARRREELAGRIEAAEARRRTAADALAEGESRLAAADKALKAEEQALGEAREARVRAEAAVEQAAHDLEALAARARERLDCRPEEVLAVAELDPGQDLPTRHEVEAKLARLVREREGIGPVNLRAEAEADELEERIAGLQAERQDLTSAIARLRQGIASLNREGRERLLAAFEQVNAHFQETFVRLFGGGRAHLDLTESEDPLEAGLEIMASPPGKRLQVMSLLSGGEQAMAALALLFAVFLTNPAPICVLDEVDAPLDDANVDRFCTLLGELAHGGSTRFLVITHHRMTMARMDRLFGVTMGERGVSQLVSVDLLAAEALRESA